eukprot:gnl/TRDRNA2_/TRDRNA2_176806_c0_seq4.p1 gnl/TRDRNA2_/TRDRNA2_176806_c0~~gnl/TRDRNA2_/TRDRNA2_176806_c0_seq4.p1  ORF type:complete len:370 (-),score=57.62 gnl/TRDRNA2_/TRDRNA2_176806_c0_seq4:161-1270(-)
MMEALAGAEFQPMPKETREYRYEARPSDLSGYQTLHVTNDCGLDVGAGQERVRLVVMTGGMTAITKEGASRTLTFLPWTSIQCSEPTRLKIQGLWPPLAVEVEFSEPLCCQQVACFLEQAVEKVRISLFAPLWSEGNYGSEGSPRSMRPNETNSFGAHVLMMNLGPWIFKTKRLILDLCWMELCTVQGGDYLTIRFRRDEKGGECLSSVNISHGKYKILHKPDSPVITLKGGDCFKSYLIVCPAACEATLWTDVLHLVSSHGRALEKMDFEAAHAKVLAACTAAQTVRGLSYGRFRNAIRPLLQRAPPEVPCAADLPDREYDKRREKEAQKRDNPTRVDEWLGFNVGDCLGTQNQGVPVATDTVLVAEH